MKALIVIGILIAALIAVQVIPDVPIFNFFDGRLYMAYWDITVPLVVMAIVSILVTLYVIGSRMEQAESAAGQAEPSAGPTSSSKRYWQCPSCGAIHFKNEGTAELVALLDTIPSGGSTCSDCGTRSDAGEIYSGALDLDAPDELIDRMLADPGNVSSDPDTKLWHYQGHVIRGPASHR